MVPNQMSRYYRVSEPILLLIFTSAPIGWWVILGEKYGYRLPYPPIAYIIASILATLTASYTLTVRLYPGLGWGENTTAERHAKSILNQLSIALALAATGILPDDDTTDTRYLYLAIYALSVGPVFHSLRCIYAESDHHSVGGGFFGTLR